jgi:ABC-type nitrate/sulfonate/bicarbonate transport system permease component
MRQHIHSKTKALPLEPTATPLAARAARRRVMRPHAFTVDRLSGVAITLLSLTCVLGFWEVFGRQVDPLFASYPSQVAASFWELLNEGVLLPALSQSVQALSVGFGMAVVVGIAMGLLIGSSWAARAALGVYVTAGFSTPMVALVPLFVLWFGLGFTAKVAMVFTMAVFPIIINTADGVRSVPNSWREVARSFAASRLTLVRTVIVPATVPSVMTGLRIAVGRAVVGVVVAEFFTAISGLGGIIITAGNNFDTSRMFVPIIILMLLGVGLTTFLGMIERRVAVWHTEYTGQQRR